LFHHENIFIYSFKSYLQAHFDNLPEEYRMVDGAKGKWCTLLLIDAIIYILKHDKFNCHSRRAFNQHLVLYECILEELKAIDLEAYNEITKDKFKVPLKKRRDRKVKTPTPQVVISNEKFEKFSQLALQELQHPWNSLESLRQSMEDGPLSKAKNKFAIVLGLLTSHECLKTFDFDLNTIIQLVITKCLFALNPQETLPRKKAGSESSGHAVAHHMVCNVCVFIMFC
jgi:hypothetical protein